MGYIVIAVIIFFIFLFFRNKQEEVQRVQSQGGFNLKYGVLINHFLRIPKMKIEKKNRSSITMAVKDPNVITRFTVSHGFEDVSIYWQHISTGFGNHSLNWKFPESMPQVDMINIIEQELGAYERKLIRGN